MATHPPDLRIALAFPNLWDRPETFIAAHERHLRTVVLRLSHGTLPLHVGDGRSLMSRSRAGRLLDRVMALPSGGALNALLRVRLADELRRAHVDVLLAEYASTASELVPVCVKAGIPLVAHFHGHDAYRPRYIEQYGGYRLLFEHAAKLVVVSRHMEKRIIALGAPPEKVVYNCYGIDVERFQPGDPALAPPVFAAVGRFTHKKSPGTTIRAFHEVWSVVPNASLVMVGDGPLLPECQALAGELGIAGVVRFTGPQDHAAVATMLKGARAFVQHSVVAGDNDHEGTPLAVLEAMASGLPVVATRHAGIPDVVQEGVHGLLCDEHDVEGMAAGMLRLAQNGDLAHEMGRAGRAHVETHHRVQDSVARLQQVLVQAATRR